MKDFRPLERGGRRTIPAILITFALVSAVSITLSWRATGRSRHQAAVVQVAARQRTLAERYVTEVLLVRSGQTADPALTGRLLQESADVLLDGGEAPAVNGDDDDVQLPATGGRTARLQLMQERRLVHDLTATGAAYLANRPVTAVRLTAGEHLSAVDPVERLRILAAVTSNVSLDAAHTIATRADRNITNLITTSSSSVSEASSPPCSSLSGSSPQLAGRRRTSAAWSPPRPISCSCSGARAVAT